MLTFKKNGRIDVPNGVGFIPDEYHGWDFDEASQEIIFTEQMVNHEFVLAA